MKKIVLGVLAVFTTGVAATAAPAVPANARETVAIVESPDCGLHVDFDLLPGGKPCFTASLDGKALVTDAPLGLVTDFADFTQGLQLKGTDVNVLNECYELRQAKTSHVHYKGNEIRLQLENPDGWLIDLVMRVSDNDLAYRYEIPHQKGRGSARVMHEASGVRFPQGTTAFVCPQSDPMIGWKRSKPSYEEEYEVDVPLCELKSFGHGYTFPCLFRINGDGWVLASETGVDSRYCASHLSDPDADGVMTIAFPMPEENNGNGTVEPGFALPGATPWRTLTLGVDLAPIAETTVPWDVVTPRYESKTGVTPGRGAWSWIIWQDDDSSFENQVAFIDMAQKMGYEYVLIDAGWDKNIGYDRMPELVRYAKEKGVDPFLWYSSSGYWNDITQSPVNKMDSNIARKQEMKWMQDLGVKGIKVDFFGGDKQETIRLYEEILSDADDHGLMVIFHGCTIPRGWERMYPNYVGSEAVLASENHIFQQHFCDESAKNATLHPFIRNAVGCMEFGGTFLQPVLNRSNEGGTVRRTTDAFELATAVLYQNPIQNFALTPLSLEIAPEEAIQFMKDVPTVWDETRLLQGYPGKNVMLARRHGDDWYVVALNASDEPLKVDVAIPATAAGDPTVTSTGKKGELRQAVAKRPKDGRLKATVNKNDAAVWRFLNDTTK